MLAFVSPPTTTMDSISKCDSLANANVPAAKIADQFSRHHEIDVCFCDPHAL